MRRQFLVPLPVLWHPLLGDLLTSLCSPSQGRGVGPGRNGSLTEGLRWGKAVHLSLRGPGGTCVETRPTYLASLRVGSLPHCSRLFPYNKAVPTTSLSPATHPPTLTIFPCPGQSGGSSLAHRTLPVFLHPPLQPCFF